MENNIRIGVIGVGNMGRNHLRVLSAMSGVEVAYVFDVRLEAARKAAAQYGVRALESLDSAEGVDAIVICTSTPYHAEYVERFAPNVRAIFVEKPLADSLSAARRVARVAEKHGNLIQVGFIERFNPAVIALQPVLRDAEKIINVDFVRTSKVDRIDDTDVVMDLMIHDLDLALCFNGAVKRVEAEGVKNGDLIEFASAHLRHENGSVSRLQASRITDKKIRLIQATCGDRFIDCDLLRREIVIHRSAPAKETGFGGYSITSKQQTVAVAQQEALLSELQAFVAHANGSTKPAIPGLKEGIESLRIAEEVVARIMKGKA